MYQHGVVDRTQVLDVWRRLAAEIAGDEVAEADVEGALASIETLQQLVDLGEVELDELSELAPGDIVEGPGGLVAVLRVEGETVIVADHGVRVLGVPGPWTGVARKRAR